MNLLNPALLGQSASVNIGSPMITAASVSSLDVEQSLLPTLTGLPSTGVFIVPAIAPTVQSAEAPSQNVSTPIEEPADPQILLDLLLAPQIPEAPVPQAPVPQAPALQAPALQAPALQAPALQAPALQAPALQVPVPAPELSLPVDSLEQATAVNVAVQMVAGAQGVGIADQRASQPVTQVISDLTPLSAAAGIGDSVTIATQPASTLPLRQTGLQSQVFSGVLPASKSIQQPLSGGRDESVNSPPLPQTPVASALSSAPLNFSALSVKAPVIMLPAAPHQQSEALQQALGERLNLHISEGTQKATIRLDPPHLGKLDIAIEYAAGKLQVQIQAAQPEVTRLLLQVSHELRASLNEQHTATVSVQISTQNQNGDGRQQPRQREQPPAAIATNHEEVAAQPRTTDGTILTMV